MRKQIVIFGLLLVVITTSVLAADAPPGVVPVGGSGNAPSTDQVNRYLSAEAVRHMDEKSDEMLQIMQDYQDENFRAWDARMYSLMDDIKMKFVIGGLGAMMLAMGLVAYVMMNHFKRYSYETYLQGVIDTGGKTGQPIGEQPTYQAVPEQMQDSKWYPQETQSTIGSEMGQGWASEQTAMNQWQAQPVYDGAWQSPIETHSEYKEQWMAENYPQYPNPAPKQQQQYPVQQPLEDPYDSPEWGGQ